MDKTAVMGILDRDMRKVRAKVVPNVRRNTLQTEVMQQVCREVEGSTPTTGLATTLCVSRYAHEFVNHAERYVQGQVHTNGLENFWRLLKRTIHGTYVAVEPFHIEALS